MKLIIEDDEGRKTVVPIVREDVEITIGRQEGNTIRLTERNVSRRHAKLTRRDGSVIVEDLGSYNGVKINGDKIQGSSPVNEGDLVQIGDYDLAIQYEEGARPAPAPKKVDEAAPTQQEMKAVGEEADDVPDREDAEATPPPPAGSSSTKRRESTSIINPGQLKNAQKRKVVDIDVNEAPRLVIVGGELGGREFACIRTEIKIGRTEDNDIAIDHRSLSRNHCKVVREDDGEWKIIDLQSSNGVQVNGEPYAESVLHPGDTIELGHLKMRFVAAGEDLPTETTIPVVGAKSGKAVPIAIAAVVLIAALGVGGYFLAKSRKADTKAPDQAAQAQPVELPPVKAPADVPAPDQQLPQGDNAQAQQQAEPAQQEPVNVDPKLAKSFEAGKALLASGHYAEAEKKLAPAADGKVPGAEAALAKARSEMAAKIHLAAAQKKLLDKDLDGARAELEQIPDDSAFAPEAGQLEGRIAESDEKTRRQRDAADAKAHADQERQAAQAQSTQTAEPESKQAQARAALKKGKELASDSNKRYKEAIVSLERALALDPSLAEAHFILGTCHARLGNLKMGAFHYEEFVHMAPNDPSAAEVVQVLRDYFKSSGERPRWPLPGGN